MIFVLSNVNKMDNVQYERSGTYFHINTSEFRPWTIVDKSREVM